MLVGCTIAFGYWWVHSVMRSVSLCSKYESLQVNTCLVFMIAGAFIAALYVTPLLCDHALVMWSHTAHVIMYYLLLISLWSCTGYVVMYWSCDQVLLISCDHVLVMWSCTPMRACTSHVSWLACSEGTINYFFIELSQLLCSSQKMFIATPTA